MTRKKKIPSPVAPLEHRLAEIHEAYRQAQAELDAMQLAPLDSAAMGDGQEWANMIFASLPAATKKKIFAHATRLVELRAGPQDDDINSPEHQAFEDMQNVAHEAIVSGFSLALSLNRETLTRLVPRARKLLQRKQAQVAHLKKANVAKRRKLERFDGRLLDKDARDAAICREFTELAASIPRVGDRERHLAEKYGFEDRRQIYNIRKRAAQQGR